VAITNYGFNIHSPTTGPQQQASLRLIAKAFKQFFQVDRPWKNSDLKLVGSSSVKVSDL
jgi:hypothetical protein